MKMKRVINLALILSIAGLVLAGDLTAEPTGLTLKEYYYLGEFYFQVGQYDKAIENYEELIRKYPTSREAEKAWLSIGDVYVRLLEQDQRGSGQKLKSLSAAAESFKQKALNSYQKVVDNFPNSAGLALIRIGKVHAFYCPGEEELGRVKFREVVDNFPEEAGRAALFLGDSYLHQKQAEQAKTAYYQARFFYPEVAAQAQVLFSRVDLEQKDYSSVVDALSPVLSTLGIDGYFNAYYYSGNIMQQAVTLTAEGMEAEGNHRFVVEHLKNIVSRYPDTNIALQTQLELAKFYSKQGKNDLARNELGRIISRYPQSHYAVQAHLAEAEIVSTEEAIQLYKSLQKSFPRSKFWVTASISAANKHLELAQGTTEVATKNTHRALARAALMEIIRRYPRAPEAGQAQEILKSNQL